VAYSAKKGGKPVLMLDRETCPAYDGITCGPVFRRDGVLECMAAEGNILYRLTSRQ
jgi:hypothetical protein